MRLLLSLLVVCSVACATTPPPPPDHPHHEIDREATKAIMASILKGKSEVVACARDHYGRGAGDAYVRIHFAISAAGVPEDVRVIQAVTADERMQRCLMQVISNLNFPPECAGRQVDFPFTF